VALELLSEWGADEAGTYPGFGESVRRPGDVVPSS